jgi:WD40 repeat protein
MGAMKAWDLSEYKCLGSCYPKRQSGASSVCISQDDQVVIVGYRDGTIRGFDVLGQNYE